MSNQNPREQTHHPLDPIALINEIPIAEIQRQPLLTAWQRLQNISNAGAAHPAEEQARARQSLDLLYTHCLTVYEQHKDCQNVLFNPDQHGDYRPCTLGTVFQPTDPAVIATVIGLRLKILEEANRSTRDRIRVLESQLEKAEAQAAQGSADEW